MKNRVFLGAFSLIFLFMLCVSASVSAEPAFVTDIQYWLAPDHIQTILSFDRAVQPTYHFRTNPERFVLEIPDCKELRGGQAIPVNDITLERIRVQRLKNGTSQIVFDLARKVEATVQILESYNGQPDRVVVNLFDQVAQAQVEQERDEIKEMTQRLKQDQYRIVVLDPGHGGRDPGAVGPNGTKEKDVVLDLARKIQARIQKQAPDIKVYLTRDGDYFLSLPKRSEIAQEYHADLFVSLHVNANPNRKVNGFSVYTLSEKATDDAARRLAEQENAADVLFGGQETPIPDDSDGLLTFVLADLSATASLQHSLEVGRISVDTVTSALKSFGIHKEGLKRANFVVLRTADMPAILVEACYISNKREETLLNQKEFRGKLSETLSKSILSYFTQLGTSSNQQQMVEASHPMMAMAQTAKEPSQYRVHVVKSGESLSIIAGRYNVNLAHLRQVNQLASADLIYIGQRLWIP